MNAPLLYSPDVESVPSDELEDTQKILDTMRELLVRDHAQSGQKRRDVHVKSHGCPVAQLHVLPRLPPELRQGLFAQEKIYSGVVRFSNSSPWPQADAIPDARGAAIQIQGVSGEFVSDEAGQRSVQDFIMVNHPTFVAKDVKDYLRLQQARLNSNYSPLAAIEAFTRGSWNPQDWHWRETFAVASVFTQAAVHPARLTYYSMAPIRFGDYVAKYRLKLAASDPDLHWSVLGKLSTHADGLRLALTETLRATTLLFELQVQLRTNPQSMPIEDATIEWPEQESPYRPVANLILPQQDLDSAPQGLGDDLSFSVWHALEAHRPLGGINRVRRVAYQFSAAWRSGQPTQQAQQA